VTNYKQAPAHEDCPNNPVHSDKHDQSHHPRFEEARALLGFAEQIKQAAHDHDQQMRNKDNKKLETIRRRLQKYSQPAEQ
jgi:hypothetical protein